MKIPDFVLEKFAAAAQGVDYGIITLSLHKKSGNCRYVISREESFLAPTDRLSVGKETENCEKNNEKTSNQHRKI